MEVFKKLAKYSWMVDIFKKMEKTERTNFITGYKNRKQYYTMEGIKANLKDLLKCANCPNMCRFDCPTLQITKRETYSPAKKAQIAYFFGMNYIPFEEKSAQNALYACVTCDACREWCPMDISTGDLLVEMRQELDQRSLAPEAVLVLKNRANKNGTIFEESPFHMNSEFNINDPDPEVFYYIGCMDIQNRPETVRATIQLLRHLKIPFATRLDQRQCCGGPMYKAGFRKEAKKISTQNQQLLKNFSGKTVITNCPGCFATLNKIYDNLETPIKIKVIHSIEFFLEKIQQGVLKLGKPVNKTICFHDPCLISRNSSVKNYVADFRNLFKLIPGLKLQEPLLHGNETRCCGMGGTYAVSNPSDALKLHIDRLNQLQETNSDLIVSACPTCEYAFQKAQTEIKSNDTQILDFIELLALSIDQNK
ncbi:(Fe-S)-binding protein [Candidatus Harpocratesius sp.]